MPRVRPSNLQPASKRHDVGIWKCNNNQANRRGEAVQTSSNDLSRDGGRRRARRGGRRGARIVGNPSSRVRDHRHTRCGRIRSSRARAKHSRPTYVCAQGAQEAARRRDQAAGSRAQREKYPHRDAV